MAIETAVREQAVASAIREISHIATLPEITLKIIQLVEDPSSTAQDLNAVIARDPALCTRILKVVNSAFYGLPGQIGSINRAIVLLGLNAVKNIAIAASLAKLFKGGNLTAKFCAKDLWEHSTTVATGTRLIATRLKLGLTDEAFLAGLIHDVGIMVEMQFDRNRLVDVLERSAAENHADFLAVEESIFHASHQDFGAGLCEKWKFPRAFGHVCGHHHAPLELPPDSRLLPTMVAVADRMAAALDGAIRVDQPSAEIPSEWLDELKISREDVDEILAALPEAVQEVQLLLA